MIFRPPKERPLPARRGRRSYPVEESRRRYIGPRGAAAPRLIEPALFLIAVGYGLALVKLGRAGSDASTASISMARYRCIAPCRSPASS